MVLEKHHADCEEVDAVGVVSADYEPNDSELIFCFVINQEDRHHAKQQDGGTFTILPEKEEYPNILYLPINIERLVNHKILEEILQEDLISFRQLIDPDLLEKCVGESLVAVGNNLFDPNYLFLNNSVERLQKVISVQIYNLFNNAAATNGILVGLKIVNEYVYDCEEEYHQMKALRMMEHARRDNDQYEDELVQSASMEMEQPVVLLIGASTASIDALERTMYKPEECNQVTSCSVCYQEFIVEEEIRKMPCSSCHIFHTECIEKWLKINHRCPICRYDMPTE